jgi:hypothetical protein
MPTAVSSLDYPSNLQRAIAVAEPEGPETGLSTATVPSSVDTAATLFLNTKWRSSLDDSEASDTSSTPHVMEPDSLSYTIAEEQVPLSEPISSCANLSGDMSEEPANALLVGFSGHTWSWQYGPNDIHVEAAEVVRCMEGNWFRKTDYSQIIYQAYIDSSMRFSFRIERGADTYARYFRIYLGNTEIHTHIINSNDAYYSSTIDVPDWVSEGWYFIKLQINYGGYVEKGWCLRYWQITEPDSEGYWQPVRTDYQEFHKARTSELKFVVPMGPETVLNVNTFNCHDLLRRYLFILVDGNLKATVYAPGAYEVYLGDYVTSTLHELTIQLYYGDGFLFGDYSKSISQLYVSYDYKHVEVDSMSGHEQIQLLLDWVGTVYRVCDYRRVEFHIDETNIPHDTTLTYSEVNAIQISHFAHEGQERWAWGLFGHYLEGAWGWAEFPLQRFVVGDQTTKEFLNGTAPLAGKMMWIVLHEFGHLEAMPDFSGYKTDAYAQQQYGFTYMDWFSPHYASSSWRTRLEWVVTVW